MVDENKKDFDPVKEIVRELKRYYYGTKRIKAKDLIISEKD